MTKARSEVYTESMNAASASGDALHAAVAAEIHALHVVFEGWMRGDLSDMSRVEAALAPSFTFISPQGQVVPRATLLEGLRQGHGGRQLRIRIENVHVRHAVDGAVVATYEEWHEHADDTTARQSTVVLSQDAKGPGGFRWRLVHETWLRPPAARPKAEIR